MFNFWQRDPLNLGLWGNQENVISHWTILHGKNTDYFPGEEGEGGKSGHKTNMF